MPDRVPIDLGGNQTGIHKNAYRNLVKHLGLQEEVQIMDAAALVQLARAVKAAVKLPVMQAARVNDVATARHAISSGAVDLIGMTRAHMADPHIVRKIVAGREDSIRPCVGANFCLDRIYQFG